MDSILTIDWVSESKPMCNCAFIAISCRNYSRE